ncbi:GNAT family N-acetyltransferase [Pseudonocardia sp. KRD291]|uniref:GNAT family N-acetyltransferase n=1 Tax=Pseudonocardia sp. KRD291 TaxID=2792007 RepID=UPI001C49F047|nr:GNAT family N-acetyltransferase [Pseudonocardia sp. KRD291]MBW0101954.1 N-acetyltransferase [Pseudonocardia sp. KRD291]
MIRQASRDDGPACAALYAPYVTDTVITFESEPPTAVEMADRIEAANLRHAWLVAEDDDGVLGYAYGGEWKPRAAYRWTCEVAAYRWTCEVSVYLRSGVRRTGAGRALYEALFARLVERGHLVAVAGMTLPNDASRGLHRALGFEPVGTHRRVGWKHGAWHDVAWVQKTLAHGTVPPAEPA